MATCIVYLEGAGFIESFRSMKACFSEKLDQAMQFSHEAAEAVTIRMSRVYHTTAVEFMDPFVSGRAGFLPAGYLGYSESHGFVSESKGFSYSVFDADIFRMLASVTFSRRVRQMGRWSRLSLLHEIDLVSSYKEGSPFKLA